MSDKPIAGLAFLSTLGGVIGYTRAASIPSLAAGVGIGSLMAVAAMRISDRVKGGYELATVTSAAMLIPMTKRLVATRKPVPMVMALLAATSTGYYANAVYEERNDLL